MRRQTPGRGPTVRATAPAGSNPCASSNTIGRCMHTWRNGPSNCMSNGRRASSITKLPGSNRASMPHWRTALLPAIWILTNTAIAGPVFDVAPSPQYFLGACPDFRQRATLAEGRQSDLAGERPLIQPLWRELGEGLAHHLAPMGKGIPVAGSRPNPLFRLHRLHPKNMTAQHQPRNSGRRSALWDHCCALPGKHQTSALARLCPVHFWGDGSCNSLPHA